MRTIRSWVGCAAPLALASLAVASPQGWKVVGWNDLGMHCMDSDYAVFSILPPFNNVQAHLIDPSGNLLTSLGGMKVTYEAVADPSGSIDRTSIGKTNFWSYAGALYGGSSVPDTGLAGFDMPGPANVPQTMAFDTTAHVFHADGVPITPFDDAHHRRTYPLMRLVARNGAGTVVATSDVVLPISDEMDCSVCHASGSGPAAKPAAGWVFDANQIHDYRLNILRLHDERQAFDPTYAGLLAQAGYLAGGLYATAVAGTPILCARCHASNALPGTGLAGVLPLTSAVHGFHASVVDPVTGMTLESTLNRASCYRCHPGSETRCLRGAMVSAVASNGSRAMQCQSCHGSMSEVGNPVRQGWLEEPVCQSCHTGTATHNNGQIRYTSVFESSGVVRQAVDATFATNPNVPVPGTSLYRFSEGHGGLRCEACHGSTHAIYPSAHGNDNLQNIALQGHEGTLVECGACHRPVPGTVSGGPHGMHPVGQSWVSAHEDAVEQGGYLQCRPCHGLDDRGTELSQMHADRTLNTEWGSISFARGARIGCYACHRGPANSNRNNNRRPTVQDAVAQTSTAPVTIALQASDPDGNPLTLRIVQQPPNGRVALAGTTATYYPEPGFAGDDVFTFMANDGSIDSAPGKVTVTRLATWVTYGAGYPGTAGRVPTVRPTADPKLGTVIGLQLENVAGVTAAGVLLFSTERASIPTQFGGLLLTEPKGVLLVTLPAAGALLSLPIPQDPVLLGLGVDFQLASVDAGARFGLAFSDGLGLVPGM